MFADGDVVVNEVGGLDPEGRLFGRSAFHADDGEVFGVDPYIAAEQERVAGLGFGGEDVDGTGIFRSGFDELEVVVVGIDFVGGLGIGLGGGGFCVEHALKDELSNCSGAGYRNDFELLDSVVEDLDIDLHGGFEADSGRDDGVGAATRVTGKLCAASGVGGAHFFEDLFKAGICAGGGSSRDQEE